MASPADEKSGEQCTSNCTDPSPAHYGQSAPARTPLEQPFHRPWCLRQGQRALRTLTQAGPAYRGTNRRLECLPSKRTTSDSSESTTRVFFPLEARIEGLILDDGTRQQVDTQYSRIARC